MPTTTEMSEFEERQAHNINLALEIVLESDYPIFSAFWTSGRGNRSAAFGSRNVNEPGAPMKRSMSTT